MINKISFSFRATFMIVGITFVILSLSLFLKGLIPSMAEFKVPEPVLSSPHYFDALLWVYVHMIVIGLLILLIGISVTDPKKQQWITMILILIISVYTYLDFRSSDSALGNGLYKGEASVAPALFSLGVEVLLILLVVRLNTKKSS